MTIFGLAGALLAFWSFFRNENVQKKAEKVVFQFRACLVLSRIGRVDLAAQGVVQIRAQILVSSAYFRRFRLVQLGEHGGVL